MGDEHAATIPIRGWRSGVVGFRTANRRGRLECKRSSGRRFWTDRLGACHLRHRRGASHAPGLTFCENPIAG